MRESKIEKRLVSAAQSFGMKAFKWDSPGNPSVPDRIILGPNRTIAFVETKAHNKEPNEGQEDVIELLSGWGFDVNVIDSPHDITSFFEQLTHNEIHTD